MYGFLSYELRKWRVGREKKKKKTESWSGVGLFEMTKFVYIIVNVGHERDKKAGKKKSGNVYGTMFFLCISEVGIE